MAWIIYALLAAILWGGTYLMYELLLKSVSASSILFASSLGATLVFLGWVVSDGSFEKDWQILKKGGSETNLLLGITLLAVLANFAFLASMRLKNATLSGLVEITYPLFTALFAWVFLKDAQLSMGTFLGALLIMAGVICISYFEKLT
ncbi:MAG: EamA family transporter [Alphaproteobacteria bacterium]|nr:EamA family transporter [Alphaproteobacteria bacterium]